MSRYSTRPIISLLCVALLAGGASLAEEETEKTRPWKDTAEIAAVVTTGNSESTTIAASNKYIYNWEESELTLDASFLRAESTKFERVNVAGDVVTTETKETTSEKYGLSGKYRRTITDGFLWYANAGWARNRIKGIDDRYTLGGGVGYRFLDMDVHKLTGEFGFDYADESRVDGTDDSFSSARGFLGYEYAINKNSTLTSEIETLYNLDDGDDLRATSVTSVTASLTQKTALKVSYTIEYDRQPVVITLAGDPTAVPPVPDATYEFETTDTTLSASLVINF